MPRINPNAKHPYDPAKRKISDRHREVLHYYFTSAKFDKTKATRMAGYRHPNKHSNHIFSQPHIQAEIKRRKQRVQRRYDITYETVIQEMAKIGFANLAKFMSFDEDTGEFIGINLNQEQMEEIACLGEITVETYIEGRGDDAERVKRVRVKPYNKLTALEAMIRHAGLSKDKTTTEIELTLVDRLRQGRERTFGRAKTEEIEDLSDDQSE